VAVIIMYTQLSA